jgi:hypothetical protein
MIPVPRHRIDLEVYQFLIDFAVARRKNVVPFCSRSAHLAPRLIPSSHKDLSRDAVKSTVMLTYSSETRLAQILLRLEHARSI